MMVSSRRDDGRVLPIFLSMVAFLGLLALVATPSYEGIVEEERALRVREVIDAVEAGCRRHHADTGKLALEYAPSGESDAYNAKRYHHLSAPQLYAGWKGPYISLGLSRADNPWGGTIELRDNLSTHPALGFELAGGLLMHERGQYLMLTQVPEESARLIDTAYDGESGEGWGAKGRVEYVLDDGGTLSIFILAAGD
jgi:hypothetical protein